MLLFWRGGVGIHQRAGALTCSGTGTAQNRTCACTWLKPWAFRAQVVAEEVTGDWYLDSEGQLDFNGKSWV